MNSNDVLRMYRKGYSVSYIIDYFYKEKLREGHNFVKVGTLLIIKNKKPRKIDVRNDVEKIILQEKLLRKTAYLTSGLPGHIWHLIFLKIIFKPYWQ